MDCRFCGYSQDHHAANCPKGNRKAEAIFWKGYKEGRTGLLKPRSKDPIFLMGFDAGVSAFEEAEKGHDPSHDG